MVYKPLDVKTYLKYLRLVGWGLKKGSVDWNLLDGNRNFLCSIKIAHGSCTKEEVIARSVHRTEQEFKKRGLSWPPQKKSKNI